MTPSERRRARRLADRKHVGQLTMKLALFLVVVIGLIFGAALLEGKM